jgi:hypothetical protein
LRADLSNKILVLFCEGIAVLEIIRVYPPIFPLRRWSRHLVKNFKGKLRLCKGDYIC